MDNVLLLAHLQLAVKGEDDLYESQTVLRCTISRQAGR
jgi:hypothetical protein